MMGQKPGRPKLYDDSIRKWLEILWTQMDYMNSKALKVALPTWMKFYQNPMLCDLTRHHILSMSPATIDRMLEPIRKRIDRSLRSGTKPPKNKGHLRFFKNQVPLKNYEQQINIPGHMQADTVAHCGGSMSGQFAWTLNLTDQLSGWTEQRAVWHKHPKDILLATIEIQTSLPFAMLSIHTDCGMEFLNTTFVDHFTGPDSKIVYTRSRPYHKDDNAYVEQKNFTHVRKLIGYERIDNRSVIELMNDLYAKEHSWLMNFFVPQRKLIEKLRYGAKTIKKYDEPKTPYQRILESKCVSPFMKEKLELLFTQLNPFELTKEIQRKVQNILKQTQQNSESSEENSDTQKRAA